MTLVEIKQQIEAFQIVHCNLHHEVVRRDAHGMPVKATVGGEEIFERVQLCKNRAQRLGCAHSGANIRFKSIFASLEEADEIINKLLVAFDKTIISIYELDHQKGFLEKDLAENFLFVEKTIANIQEEMKDCILNHDKKMTELEDIKSAILLRIDELILFE